MHCLKCRLVTETENITTAMSKNGRLMRRVQCITCGESKTQFDKKGAAGGNIIHTLVNKLPFEMYLSGHNLTDPEKELYKRLNPDGTAKEWSIPINRVDKAAYYHDLCYSKHDDTKTRNQVCDKTMLAELNVIGNPILRERIDKSIVAKLINAKVNFWLGAPIEEKKSNPKIY